MQKLHVTQLYHDICLLQWFGTKPSVSLRSACTLRPIFHPRVILPAVSLNGALDFFIQRSSFCRMIPLERTCPNFKHISSCHVLRAHLRPGSVGTSLLHCSGKWALPLSFDTQKPGLRSQVTCSRSHNQ